MSYFEHEFARQRSATLVAAMLVAEAQHRRAVRRGRKVHKRDGSSGYAEAGDQRPPAVDC